jgi:hypothetical protein
MTKKEFDKSGFMNQPTTLEYDFTFVDPKNPSSNCLNKVMEGVKFEDKFSASTHDIVDDILSKAIYESGCDTEEYNTLINNPHSEYTSELIANKKDLVISAMAYKLNDSHRSYLRSALNNVIASIGESVDYKYISKYDIINRLTNEIFGKDSHIYYTLMTDGITRSDLEGFNYATNSSEEKLLFRNSLYYNFDAMMINQYSSIKSTLIMSLYNIILAGNTTEAKMKDIIIKAALSALYLGMMTIPYLDRRNIDEFIINIETIQRGYYSGSYTI